MDDEPRRAQGGQLVANTFGNRPRHANDPLIPRKPAHFNGNYTFDSLAPNLPPLGGTFGFDARFVSLNCQDTAAYKLCDRGRYRVANESPASTVQPGGNPISFSHSVHVKFLAT